ncbi:MAG: hypothetical protein ABEI74_04455 [Candidatus Pacearchaeota archaeon]
MIFGLTGTMSSGKGEVVEYLKNQYGFEHFSVSSHLENLLRQEGNLDRDGLTEGASRLRREKNDAAFLVRNIYGNLLRLGYGINDNMIIESIRNPAEIDFLRQETPFDSFFASINTGFDTRYARSIDRGTNKDKISYQEFLRQHNQEMDSGDYYGLKVADCINKADFHIDSGYELSKVREQVDEFVDYAYSQANGGLRNI